MFKPRYTIFLLLQPLMGLTKLELSQIVRECIREDEVEEAVLIPQDLRLNHPELQSISRITATNGINTSKISQHKIANMQQRNN